jgi:hypothetical protein
VVPTTQDVTGWTLRGQALFREAGAILYADERNLFSEAIAYMLPNGSVTFVDREQDGSRNGPDRLHRVHVYMNRRQGDEPSKWLTDSSADLASYAAVLKWKLHLPVVYDNAHPAPPSPDVDHFAGPDRLNVAIAEVGFENARTAREFFLSSAFQKAMAAQERHIDALGAYLVTGFYTFVRNGVPTTAGLRGSRAAELIDVVGAANQLSPEVAGHFAPHVAG